MLAERQDVWIQQLEYFVFKCVILQAVETIKGGMDTSVLERMVKIMSYMRGTSGKPSKMKKKDKLRMLQVCFWNHFS